MFVSELDCVYRDLDTGVDPQWATPENVDGALDDAGDPGVPITTRLEGPWGLPWIEGLETPNAPTGLLSSPNPLPWSPNEDVGKEALPGAYQGAFRTSGPIRAWGHEPSGGLGGDQAIGRIMRFPANIPDRYDRYGVWNTDYKDELQAAIEMNDQPYVDDAAVTTSLLLWPNVQGRW